MAALACRHDSSVLAQLGELVLRVLPESSSQSKSAA
jgi:hypothetical protein